MTEDELHALVEAMEGKPGDLLLFAADRDKVVFDVLGNLRLELAKQQDLLKKDDFKFLWVTEFPLLEYSEEQGRFVAMHHPFTMPMDEDWHLIDSDPGAVRAKAYDIVLKWYRDGRRLCPYPSGRHPVQDVRSTGLHSGAGTGAVRIPA